jgi:hypothetical protein
MKRLLLAGVVALMPLQALAQTPDYKSTPPAQPDAAAAADASLATPTGHEINASVGTYTYSEPGDQSISIHGPKLGGEYAATLSLSKRRLWFVQADGRGTIGNVTCDGWCSPWPMCPTARRQMAIN